MCAWWRQGVVCAKQAKPGRHVTSSQHGQVFSRTWLAVVCGRFRKSGNHPSQGQEAFCCHPAVLDYNLPDDETFLNILLIHKCNKCKYRPFPPVPKSEEGRVSSEHFPSLRRWACFSGSRRQALNNNNNNKLINRRGQLQMSIQRRW